MDPYVMPKSWELLALAAIKTALLDGSIVKLFKNDFTPSLDTVVGDMTEADYTGYLAVTLTTWQAPFLDVQGRGEIRAPHAFFAPAAPYTVQNTIYGYWIIDSTADLLLASRFVNGPIPMGEAGNALFVEPFFILQNPT